MLISSDRKKELNSFNKKYKLNFKNLELLNQAFLHTSYIFEEKLGRIESYERLEFLGDAVLKLAVSNLLYNEYPNLMEGKLTEKRAIIVSDKTIAEFAKTLGLDDLILVGKCEGEIKKESILACSFEALLGAIYLEKGYKKAESFLLTNFEGEILKIDYINPKAKLQELTQKYNHNLPEYIVMEERGPAHDRIFTVGVYYENKFIEKGEAKSKKEAEFIAAKKAYDKLKEIYKEN